ncbi:MULTISPECIES: hypothetical protein [Paraburkholderia]|uniref:Uncharacterized protein n=1 Tax=Paraburkholderia madseniana TaxID=2599607 RepID=A0AAP5ENN8_9BURK|nr:MULTISPECIES: hypothetical protein [Paraburkholderia]MCX4146765.1 hypothetical protein [Paraburkholderia madseniana]MDN7149711.1 hypothetical protein [Paraburkholderia sp. WS6]MDQ6408591.1 hypothetical protein [Paraburkholderia madseniana]
MFDDFSAYFYENVVRSFNEYQRTKASGVAGASDDIRTAMAAASALFHLREHLPRSFAMSRSKAERLCTDYGVLADIANTAKHRALDTATPHGAPLLRSAADLKEEIVITEYCDQEGAYKHVEKRVTAGLIDGTTRDVLEVLTNVMNFWQTYLHDKGVIAKPRIYAVESAQQPRPRAEANDGQLGLLITPGLRFKGSARLQKYNYVTGKLEPIDLTGSEAKLTVYAPQQYQFDMSITHEPSGTTLKRTIKLTEEESRVFAGLRTDAERQAYVSGLPSTHATFKELHAEAESLQTKTAGNEES